MKIVLNKFNDSFGYGEFELCNKALDRLIELKLESTGYKNVYYHQTIYDKDGKRWERINPIDTYNDKNSVLLTNEVFNEVTKLSYDDFKKLDCFNVDSVKRDDEDLVTVVEEMGWSVGKNFCNPKVVEIPDDCDWIIEKRFGVEFLYYSQSEIKVI